MSLARHSSSLRRGVTLGCGMLLSTWLSIISAQRLRTWGVSFFRAVQTMGRMRLQPWYSSSRPSILDSSGSYAALARPSLSCHSRSRSLSLFFILWVPPIS